MAFLCLDQAVQELFQRRIIRIFSRRRMKRLQPAFHEQGKLDCLSRGFVAPDEFQRKLDGPDGCRIFPGLDSSLQLKSS